MNNEKNVSRNLRVGDIIQTREPFGPNPAGSIGIVYETYAEPGTPAQPVASILLTNGHDIGSFAGNDQDESLAWLGHSELTYAYVSPAQLMQDYRNGNFRRAFEQARAISQHKHKRPYCAEPSDG